MFTGIIQSIGEVQQKEFIGGDLLLTIITRFKDMSRIRLGDSIAMDGVCLTVTSMDQDVVTVDVSVETVNKTTVGDWHIGRRLNLESALTLQDQLGGHLVFGHVDAVGHCIGRESSARSEIFSFKIPIALDKYVAAKGSITINGTSLTVNTIENGLLSVNLVPHTLTHTNLGDLNIGDAVNVEVDTVARYVEKMLNSQLVNTK